MITTKEPLTLAGLKRVALVPPLGAGAQWQGIPHGVLIQTILNEADARNWEYGPGRYALGRMGADLSAAIDVSIPGVEAPTGWTITLAATQSNARRGKLRFYCGVTNIKNGVGVMTYVPKHDDAIGHVTGTQASLESRVRMELRLFEGRARRASFHVGRLKETQVNEALACHTLFALARGGALPWSRLRAVDHTLRARPIVCTLWHIVCAVGAAIKRSPPTQQVRQLAYVHRHLESENHMRVKAKQPD